jgi:hypothetical protein
MTMYDPVECACVAGNMPTMEEQNTLQANCEAEANTAYTNAGGSIDDLADAMANGAQTESVDAWTTCYENALAAASLAEVGVCDTKSCYPPYVMAGMEAGDETGWMNEDPWSECVSQCAPPAGKTFVNEAQKRPIRKKCDNEAQEKMIAAGGSAEDFAMAKDEAAMTAGATNAMNCFDNEFANTASDAACPDTGCSWL